MELVFPFNFNSAPYPGGAGDIETYMEDVYGSDITVSGSTIKTIEKGGGERCVGSSVSLLGTEFSFSFNSVPITSVSFDWSAQPTIGTPFGVNYYVYADNVMFFSRECTSWESGSSGTTIFAAPVTTLRFSFAGCGNAEVDNLNLAVASVPSAILLIAPNGGEVLTAGSTYPITWSSTGSISNVKIEYSTDNGSNWTPIDTVPNTGSYDWLVPAVNSNQCLVRVSDASNPSISDTSNAVFTIRSLGWQAAELAKILTKRSPPVDYLWGAKGYDFSSQKFLAPEAVLQLDCSGLILWAYDRAYYEDTQISWGQAIVTQNCVDTKGWGRCISEKRSPVYCEGAYEQCKFNSYAIPRGDLDAGDLIFIPGTPYNHIAMCVGDGKVVHASYSAGAVVEEDLIALEETYPKLEYRRVKMPPLFIEDGCPIDLVITTPDRLTISKQLCEVPRAEYIEYDVNGINDFHDIVIVYDKKPGNYLIEVVPEPNALPTDTYSLEATIDGQTMVLAQDVQIQDIPIEPYEFKSKLNRSDFDNNGEVSFLDLAFLSSHWLGSDCNYPNWCEGADLNYSGAVDFNDFAIFAQNWLWEKILADLDINGDVDFADFNIFANRWLEGCNSPDWCYGCDLDKSGSVDTLDLAEFARHWLEGG